MSKEMEEKKEGRYRGMEGGRGNSLRWRLEAVSDELLMLLYLSGGPGSMYSNNTHTHTEIYIVCSLSLSLYSSLNPLPLSLAQSASPSSLLSLSRYPASFSVTVCHHPLSHTSALSFSYFPSPCLAASLIPAPSLSSFYFLSPSSILLSFHLFVGLPACLSLLFHLSRPLPLCHSQ